MTTLVLTLPLPPSAHTKGSAKKRQWLEAALASMPRPDAPKGLLSITIRMYGNWTDERGAPRHKAADWDRLATPIQDAVAKACGFDDRWVKRALVEQIDSAEEYAVVTIEPWSP